MIWAGYGRYGLGAVLAAPSTPSFSSLPIGTNTSTGSRVVTQTVDPLVAALRQSSIAQREATTYAQTQASSVRPTNVSFSVAAKPAGSGGKSFVTYIAEKGITGIGNKPPVGAGGPSTAGSGSSSAAPAGTPQSEGAMPPGSTFPQECVAQGGQWQGDGCMLPDGSKWGQGADGSFYCMNQAGRCAGAQPASKMGGAVMIGAAALAALLFLR